MKSITPTLFEAIDLNVHSMDIYSTIYPQPPQSFVMGGDSAGFSNTSNTLASQEVQSSYLRNYRNNTSTHSSFTALRSSRWVSHRRSTGTVSWEAKLSVDGKVVAQVGSTAGTLDMGGSSSILPKHDTLGYEWFIEVTNSEGAVRTIASDVCFGADKGEGEGDGEGDGEGEGEGEAPNEAAFGSGTRSNILEAWSWKRFEVPLHGMQSDDMIVLYAKPISDQYNYPPATLKKCTVVASSFELSNTLDRTLVAESIGRFVENSVDLDICPTAIYAIYNDGGCTVP